MLEFIKTIYGEDAITVSIKIIFEFSGYFLCGIFGAALHEYYIKKDKCLDRIGRILIASLVSAIIMFSLGNYIKTIIKDFRELFIVSTIINFIIPSLFTSIRNGTFLKPLIGLFAPKIRTFLDDIEKENKKK